VTHDKILKHQHEINRGNGRHQLIIIISVPFADLDVRGQSDGSMCRCCLDTAAYLSFYCSACAIKQMPQTKNNDEKNITNANNIRVEETK